MRPAIVLSVVLIGLSVVVYNLIAPRQPKVQPAPAVTQETVQATLPADKKPDLPHPNPTVIELQRATAILDDAKRVLVGEDDEKHVTLAVLELSRAIVEQHVLKTTLSTAQLDEALAAMFVDPNDPNSSMREDIYKDLETGVWQMSQRHEVKIFRATKDEYVFARRPKQEWKVAHVYIRVEHALDDGTKKVSGVIISAPLRQ